MLRRQGLTDDNRQKGLEESLDLAKKAVAQDLKDGESWLFACRGAPDAVLTVFSGRFVLGNAYLALFFFTLAPDMLQQATKVLIDQERRQEERKKERKKEEKHKRTKATTLFTQDAKEAKEIFSSAPFPHPPCVVFFL